MKREAMLEYYIYNGKLLSTNTMNTLDGVTAEAVYEVIKIIDGIPLFFDEHLDRMKQSLLALGVELSKSREEILKEILQLVRVNQCKSINVKLLCNCIRKDKIDVWTYFIKSEYPSEKAYRKGIHTILFKGERENPNIKTLKASFRGRVKQSRKEKGAYEALLVDEQGFITEGSRSNIFFIKEGSILTPPNRKVLLGVTRKYILKICRQLGIKVKEGLIPAYELKNIQGAFITGTTVDVLPIASIEDLSLLTMESKIMKLLIKVYKQERMSNIEKQKKELEEKSII